MRPTPIQLGQSKLTNLKDIELSLLEWTEVPALGQMLVIHKNRLYAASIYMPNTHSKNRVYFTMEDYEDMTDCKEKYFLDEVNKVLGTDFRPDYDMLAYQIISFMGYQIRHYYNANLYAVHISKKPFKTELAVQKFIKKHVDSQFDEIALYITKKKR